MKKIPLRSLFAVVSIFVSTAASASPGVAGVSIDASGVELQGTGCNAGNASASVALDPDGNEVIELSFDSFTARTGPGKTLDRKKCTARIPVLPPPGYRVAFGRVSYEGQTSVSEYGKSRIVLRYRAGGTAEQGLLTEWNGGETEPFSKSRDLQLDELLTSRCGDPVILKATAVLEAEKRAGDDGETTISIDDAVGGAGSLRFTCRLVPCH